MTLHADVTSVLLGFLDVFLIEHCTNLIRFDLARETLRALQYMLSSK
jgi:hypothetical protein